VEDDVDKEDYEGEGEGGGGADARRSLRKKRKKRSITFDEGWNVHGKVIKEHFPGA
jgi:hypothetical protein